MSKRLLPVLLVLGLSASACGGGVSYAPQGVREFVTIESEVNAEAGVGSYDITLKVKFLPPPDRVADGLTTFVIWLVPDGAPAVRAGSLVYNPRNREGNGHVTYADPRVSVLVTAERTRQPAVPSEYHVFQQDINVQ